MSANARSRGLAADRLARVRAQSVFDEPIVVEAGAGTGKTSILVARIVVWSLTEGWERAARRLAADPGTAPRGDPPPEKIAAEVLSRVAAITFTEAAAAEMAQRTGSVLAEIAAGRVPTGIEDDCLPDPAELRSERSRHLIGALDHLVVRTIHAYCRGLLAQYPLEAGIHPSFQVDAEELAQAEIVREVVEAAAVRCYAEPVDPDWLALAIDGFGPAKIEDALVQLLRAGATPDALSQDPYPRERIAAYVDELVAAVTAFLSENRGRLETASGKNSAECIDAIERTRALLERGVEATVEGLSAFLDEAAEAWAGGAHARVKLWAQGRFNKGEIGALDGETEAVRACAAALVTPLGQLSDLAPARMQSAFRVLGPLQGEVAEQMRRRGAASYDSLLRGARDLLAANAGVARRVRCDLDQLLVDEFQDTDPLQCDLVRSIACAGEPDERPGLFLVGDPKQSIYGWRRADLGAYDGFTAEVLGDREPDRLSQNFRSRPEVLDEVQRAIEPVMERETGVQPAFQPLFACDAQLAAPPGAVEHWVTWSWDAAESAPGSPKAAAAAALEAEAVARDIAERHARGELAWSEAGVLFRSSGDLDVYLQAMRAAGVPYAVERDRNYYRRREIIEASALVRCVVDPNDQLALIATLRSAAVGLPDAALLPLWRRDFPRLAAESHAPDSPALSELDEVIAAAHADLPSGVPAQSLPEGWELSLRQALRVLAVLRASFAEDPADEFVEKLRRFSLLEPTEAARYLGAYRAANLDRFFRELVSELEAAGDAGALLRRLRREVDEQADAEEARPSGIEDAVRVMTIHKSKGLEFRHTYLVQLHKTGGNQLRHDKVELEQGAEGCECRLFGAQTLGFAEVAARRARVESVERVRVLYVAMTRARERLVLLGNWSEDAAPKSAEEAGTLLDLFGARVADGPDLVAAMIAAQAAGAGDGCEHGGARWRFPALWPAADGQVARPAVDEDVFDTDALRGEAERLRARRESAQRRSRRPWSRAPSHDSHGDAREAQAKARFAEPADAPAAALAARSVAKAAGTAVHGVLEDFDLAADPVAELERQRGRLPGLAAAAAGPSERAAIVEHASDLLDRIARSDLLAKLVGLRDHVVARELPVLLPPVDSEDGAVGFSAGSIDLCYRDPDTGEWVVADYKTDRVGTDAEIAERVERYTAQGRAYQRALRDALGLEAAPRFELWFLAADRVEVVA